MLQMPAEVANGSSQRDSRGVLPLSARAATNSNFFFSFGSAFTNRYVLIPSRFWRPHWRCSDYVLRQRLIYSQLRCTMDAVILRLRAEKSHSPGQKFANYAGDPATIRKPCSTVVEIIRPVKISS